MDPVEYLIRHVTYPLWMYKGGHGEIVRYLNRFDYVSRTDTRTLLDGQRQQLQAILTHAYDHTAYYRRLFDERGFSPPRMSDPGEIRALPLLTKTMVRQHYDELIAGDIRPEDRIMASTGGSTGVPMAFLYDRWCHYLRVGQELYFDHWFGYRIGRKVALFVAASHFDKAGERWKARLRNATCERMLRFDPHDITEEYMAAFVQEYLPYRPALIKSFPNSLFIFAEFLQRKGIRVPPVPAISCTGESLFEQQRRLFREVFGGEVFEKYGTKECGVIACECRAHRGMHIFVPGVYFEIIDEQGNPVKPGEMGRIVVTDLFNRGMPLIRYEIGDMAVATTRSGCACGSPLPLIDRLVGRDRDILYDSNGNPKPGYLFVEAINKLNLPAQFQIVQNARDRIIVKVARESSEDVDLKTLHTRFAEILGPGVRIDYEYVEEIKRDPSGKYRYVMSQLKR